MTDHSTVCDEDMDVDEFIRTYNIPPQPYLVTEIQKADDDIEQIAHLISQDVALSASILQVVNSPFYGLANQITSIKQATVLLGLNCVTNIVNSQLLKAEMDQYLEKDLDDFWNCATEVAQVAAALVRTLGFGSPDEAYTLGLFHNCGIPLMMDKYEDYSDVLQLAYTTENQRITDIENQHYSTNHAVLGYMVARAWKLPDSLRTAIRDHHNFERLSFSNNSFSVELDSTLAILKMAEHIAKVYSTLGKQREDKEWQTIKTPIFDFMGISEPDFLDITDSVQDKLNLF